MILRGDWLLAQGVLLAVLLTSACSLLDTNIAEGEEDGAFAVDLLQDVPHSATGIVKEVTPALTICHRPIEGIGPDPDPDQSSLKNVPKNEWEGIIMPFEVKAGEWGTVHPPIAPGDRVEITLRVNWDKDDPVLVTSLRRLLEDETVDPPGLFCP